MKTVATFRKAKRNPAFGFIVSILGEDYIQKGTFDEAQESAEAINKRCEHLTSKEVRELYTLGVH